ncbi:MAG: HAMP domain-containing protein, partial [Chloroflexi bacterium]|nr:HAMP domain-containing protein [Chloroflexota bacterium]
SSPSLGGDPSLRASGGLIEADVANLEINFNQTLDTYQQNFELATSSNMNTIRSILRSDATDHGQGVTTRQQGALDAVAQREWHDYQTLQDQVLRELDNNTPYRTAYFDFYRANQNFLPLKNHWQEVVDAATVMGTTVTQVGPSLTNPLLTYTTAAVVFTLLVIILAAFLINGTIVNPLNQLVKLTKRVAQGDTHARATIRGRDEINQVASSMNGMLDNILRLIQEAQSRHAELQAQIQHMSSQVSGMGEGNLQVQVRSASNELGMLADTFNVMAQELNNLVVNVKILARGVQNATLQAFGYMEQLVDNADTQFQHITRATEEVSQVASSNRQIAERAQVLYNVAHEARQTAHKGRRAVQQTVKGMNRINENVSSTSKKVLSLGERSREISSIVEVISGIAQQTNRLALDASIQAAMAGEHGQGFGAVAVDIRRLAERAKEQSALIAQRVRNVLEDINTASVSMRETARETATGAQIAQEVGNALEVMFSAVEHQASEIEVTNQVAMQQLQSSNMIVQIMQRVSDSTRQSGVVTHNVTQQMERLAQLAGQLLASVDVFKLREEQPGYVVVTETSTPPTSGQLAFNGPVRSIPSPAQSAERAYGRPAFSGVRGQEVSGRNMPSPASPQQETPVPTERPEQQGLRQRSANGRRSSDLRRYPERNG